jgi:heme A synthase
MLQKSVVTTAAWLEMVVGASLLTAPDYPCQLLFEAKPEGLGIALARVGGLGLFALGIACLPSTATESRRRAVFGLFVFNFGVAILLAWVGIATTFSGVLLWPTIVLHAIIAAALLAQLLTCKIVGIAIGEQRAAKVSE